jgi:hypothetical protein
MAMLTEQLFWGDSFLSVTDGLRVSQVSSRFCQIAMRLWDPTLTTWAEVSGSLGERMADFFGAAAEVTRGFT